ncbi:MAG TPA: hypothetical protein VFD70_19855 [Anaerolineae bacterium]|nr:hypothetical protein [Anaerolineae bacterium]
MAILFYLLGLSYGVVDLVMEDLGVSASKSRAYECVQAANSRIVCDQSRPYSWPLFE